MAEYFQGDRFFDSFIAAAKDVIIRPGEFFAGMPKAEAYGPAIAFFTLTMVPVFIIWALTTLGFAFVFEPFIWLFAVVSTWLWAWYLGWAVRVFTKRELDTVNAFQLLAYANTPFIFSWIPVFNVISGVWVFVLQWIGLTRSAGVSGGAALLILIVPAILMATSLGVLIVLLTALAAQQGFQLPHFPADGMPMVM